MQMQHDKDNADYTGSPKKGNIYSKKFQLKFDGPPVDNKLDLNFLNIYNGFNNEGIRGVGWPIH